MVELKKVSSKSELNSFIKFPFSIYSNAPNWVAPLIAEEKKLFDEKHNPFFENAEVEHYLAYKEGKPVGRISAILNHRHNEIHAEKTAFFGFFDFIDDTAVSEKLLLKAQEFARARGMNVLRGPMNFSTNDTCGMLTEGFDRDPVILMPYNFPYYSTHMEKLGYKKAKDLVSYEITDDVQFPEKLERVAKMVQARNSFTFEYITKKGLSKQLPAVKEIYNNAWESNWGFIPMTDKELDHMAESMKQVLEPELAFLIYKDKTPVGFSLSLPDANIAMKSAKGKLFPFGLIKILLNWKKIDSIRNITMGVIPEYRKKGLEALMIFKTIENGKKNGFRKADLGWILEDNTMMTREIENIGGWVYKKYRVYEQEV